MAKTLIIGISGTTNCGKSSLIRELVKCFSGSTPLCQDNFFLEPDDERLKAIWVPEVNHANWERFEALEMDKMMACIKKWKKNARPPAVLFIDGFLMYSYPPLLELFDRKYFMKIPFEVCHKRRMTRDYYPPDVPGYFEKVAWPMSQKHIQDIAKINDIVYLDGTADQSELLKKVCEDLRTLFPSLQYKEQSSPQ